MVVCPFYTHSQIIEEMSKVHEKIERNKIRRGQRNEYIIKTADKF